MGPDLMENMRAQAERFGAELVTDDVVSVAPRRRGQDVVTGDARGATTYRARAVILAMGSAYRELGLPDEKRLSGHGVTWCATCDGFFFRDQDIAVVGGGDSAIEEATFLTRFARSVTIVHRRDELRASKIMQGARHGRRQDHVRAGTPRSPTIHGDDKLTGVTLRDTVTGEDPRAARHRPVRRDRPRPAQRAVPGQVDLDDEGYVAGRTAAPRRTNVPGVFACGDLVDHTYRQAITAAGSGCAAALDAERYLADLADEGDADREGAAHSRRRHRQRPSHG